MLTTIREKTQGIIATFIILLIVIPFALWGINSYFEGGTNTNVATVNGDEVSEQDYRAMLNRRQGQVDPRTADSLEFKKAIVDDLVQETLLSRDADKLGYRISTVNLSEIIRGLPYFQNDGKFDPGLYEAKLRQEGRSMQQFESRVRIDIMRTQMRLGLTSSGIVTDAEVADIAKLMGQQREISYAVIPVEKFVSAATVTPEAIQQYYDAHSEMFGIPEQVRVEYVQLSVPSMMKDYTPSDAELKAAFAESSNKIAKPETRRASHIFIAVAAGASAEDNKKALATIEGIEKQVRSGVDFAKLAREKSQDPVSASKGGDLGAVSDKGVLPKSLIDAVQMLKVNEISKPIRTEFGYHLVKLTGYTPAVQRSFESAKAELVKQLRQRKSEETYYETSEKFRNLVYERAESLTPVAEALGLKIEKSDWFDRSGGAGIAARPRIVDAAFSAEVLTQHRNSDAIDAGSDTLLALRLADHRPAAVKPLADVRAQIERILRQEAAQKVAHEQGEKLLQTVAGGKSLEDVARQQGFKYQAPKTVSREQLQGLDRTVANAAFQAPRPEAGKTSTGGVDLGSTGYAIYAVKRVIDIDPANVDAALRARAKNILTAQRGDGAYSAYLSRLRKTADIKLFESGL